MASSVNESSSINNAVISYAKKLIDTIEEEWDTTLQIRIRNILIINEFQTKIMWATEDLR
jgi:hypothetical protein